MIVMQEHFVAFTWAVAAVAVAALGLLTVIHDDGAAGAHVRKLFDQFCGKIYVLIAVKITKCASLIKLKVLNRERLRLDEHLLLLIRALHRVDLFFLDKESFSVQACMAGRAVDIRRWWIHALMMWIGQRGQILKMARLMHHLTRSDGHACAVSKGEVALPGVLKRHTLPAIVLRILIVYDTRVCKLVRVRNLQMIPKGWKATVGIDLLGEQLRLRRRCCNNL